MIGHILFDLDNTLYSVSNPIDKKITERMFRFIADYLSVPLEEAKRLQAARRHHYGTTLEWLEQEHQFTDRAGYFAAVHPPCEVEELYPDDRIRGFLESLQLPMTVLTNAPLEHAERVLNFFHIRDLFLGVFDIIYHKGKGKPAAECYTNTLKAVGKSIEETLFLDDCPAYVQGYVQIGGKAALIDELHRHTSFSRSSGIPAVRSIYEVPELLAGKGVIHE